MFDRKKIRKLNKKIKTIYKYLALHFPKNFRAPLKLFKSSVNAEIFYIFINVVEDKENSVKNIKTGRELFKKIVEKNSLRTYYSGVKLLKILTSTITENLNLKKE